MPTVQHYKYTFQERAVCGRGYAFPFKRKVWPDCVFQAKKYERADKSHKANGTTLHSQFPRVNICLVR